jgi:quinol monooxygenase YgiN
MYGTIFRMKVKPGLDEKVVELFEQWNKERKPEVDGALNGYLFKPDEKADELIGVAVFRDRASYEANANNPEQDRWFRRLREILLSDPQWEDGEYVAGGP